MFVNLIIQEKFWIFNMKYCLNFLCYFLSIFTRWFAYYFSFGYDLKRLFPGKSNYKKTFELFKLINYWPSLIYTAPFVCSSTIGLGRIFIPLIRSNCNLRSANGAVFSMKHYSNKFFIIYFSGTVWNSSLVGFMIGW